MVRSHRWFFIAAKRSGMCDLACWISWQNHRCVGPALYFALPAMRRDRFRGESTGRTVVCGATLSLLGPTRIHVGPTVRTLCRRAISNAFSVVPAGIVSEPPTRHGSGRVSVVGPALGFPSGGTANTWTTIFCMYISASGWLSCVQAIFASGKSFANCHRSSACSASCLGGPRFEQRVVGTKEPAKRAPCTLAFSS